VLTHLIAHPGSSTKVLERNSVLQFKVLVHQLLHTHYLCMCVLERERARASAQCVRVCVRACVCMCVPVPLRRPVPPRAARLYLQYNLKNQLAHFSTHPPLLSSQATCPPGPANAPGPKPHQSHSCRDSQAGKTCATERAQPPTECAKPPMPAGGCTRIPRSARSNPRARAKRARRLQSVAANKCAAEVKDTRRRGNGHPTPPCVNNNARLRMACATVSPLLQCALRSRALSWEEDSRKSHRYLL